MRSDDTPRLSSADELSGRLTRTRLFDGRPTIVHRLLREAVERMNGLGEDAETRYQGALAALRAQGTKAAQALAEEYRRVPSAQYTNRWAIVQLTSDLVEPAALAFLDEVIAEPIPDERPQDPHGLSPAGKELVIRTTAVDAAARLAAQGREDALKILLKHVRNPVFSIRVACALAFQEHGPRDARRILEKRLTKRDQHILQIRRVRPSEMPPIEGHRYLPPRAEPEQRLLPTPARPNAGRAPVPPSEGNREGTPPGSTKEGS